MKPIYEAKGMEIWKLPIERQTGPGKRSITLGFLVCTASQEIGEEGAKAVAALLNLAEQAQEQERAE